MKAWKLLEPIKIGKHTLRNRIVLPPMENRLGEGDGFVNKTLIDYYVARARGGAGTIVVQNTTIDDKYSLSAPCQTRIHTIHMVSGLSNLAEAIKANGALAMIQIGHGGPQCDPRANPRQPIAPSAITCKATGVLSREATIDDIEEVQEAFAQACKRAQMAGFDGVELHGAHGYLMHSFLSPYTNHRTDKYGGKLANRALFALETIRRVRAEVGDEFVVGIRISADEYLPEGLTLRETGPFARMLEDAGINYIHVSAAIYESSVHMCQPHYMERAHLVHLAEGIKKMVTIPVVTVGSHDIYTAERALQERKADLVAMGRALIADPELPKKLALGKLDDIVPCLRQQEGCLTTADTGQPMRCEVNPACGRESDFRIILAVNRKSVLVVGGGIAGMEAARIAAMRGHDVTLVEKSDKLGGHLLAASVPEFKQEVKALLEWAVRQVKKGAIKIELNTEATPELIQKLKPEVLILAFGSKYTRPLMPCNPKANICTASDVLLGKKTVGDKVVVIGGGLIGCEIALYVGEVCKKNVTVVEMLDELFVGLYSSNRIALQTRLDQAKVEQHTGWRVDEITATGVSCSDKKRQKHELKADTIILALGLEPVKRGEEFDNLAPEVYKIGDCVEGRRIYNAFEDAWRVALSI
jgi:2,4-dienoyl-CoA reductase-like NADH-dependent reductase (Old Yellow Enzyme family)/thioredoxin reductase